MKYIWRRINEEPVAAMAVVQGVVYTATEFGLEWNGAQQLAVLGLASSVLWFLTRQRVTPTAKGTPPLATVEHETPPVR